MGRRDSNSHFSQQRKSRTASKIAVLKIAYNLSQLEIKIDPILNTIPSFIKNGGNTLQ